MIILLVLSITLSLSSHAKVVSKSLESENCPFNAFCPKNLQKEYKSFKAFIEKWHQYPDFEQRLESRRQQLGMLLPLWEVKNASHNSSTSIQWSSPCPHHNQKSAPVILKSIVFAKSLQNNSLFLSHSQINLGDQFFLDPLFVLSSSSSQILDYLIPRSEFPLYKENQELTFLLALKDIYYPLTVGPKGFKVKKFQKIDHLPQTVDCPKKLADYARGKIKNKQWTSIYKNKFCKKIWDISSKKYDIALFYQACAI